MLEIYLINAPNQIFPASELFGEADDIFHKPSIEAPTRKNTQNFCHNKLRIVFISCISKTFFRINGILSLSSFQTDSKEKNLPNLL